MYWRARGGGAPLAGCAARRRRALNLYKQHNPDSWGINPYKRVVAVRRVTWADGRTETLARFIDVPEQVVVPSAKRWQGGGDEESRRDRCRRVAEARARRELRWALASIGADHLLTCTFRANVQDHRAARKVWEYFVKIVRARYPSWKYAAVMELQERGAIHFHAGVCGYQDVKYLRTAWLRAAGDFGGNIHVKAEQRRWGGEGATWRKHKLAGYLGKYLGKAFAWMPKHAQRFTASADRVRPTIDRFWIEYALDDGEVIRSVYRLTCGSRAVGVRQWIAAGGAAYMVSSEGPPDDSVPF